MRGLVGIVYLVIGIIVAADRDYFDHLGNIDNLASALFAIALWPLLIIGIDITLR
jgi:hypothetical protein